VNHPQLLKDTSDDLWHGDATAASFDGEGLREAIADAVTAHMASITGRHAALRPLYWSASNTGTITGIALDYPEHEVPQLLDQWARTLGLPQTPPDTRPEQPRYTGTIDGWPVEVRASIDRDSQYAYPPNYDAPALDS